MQLKQISSMQMNATHRVPELWLLGVCWMLGHASLAKVPQTLAPLIELTLMRSRLSLNSLYHSNPVPISIPIPTRCEFPNWKEEHPFRYIIHAFCHPKTSLLDAIVN